MKPVIGFLLIFVGLAIGYLVLIGKLPSSASTPAATPAPTVPAATGSGPDSLSSHFPAYRGKL